MFRLWLLLFLPIVSSAVTTALFSPFPSDSLTVADASQKNGIRINLPVPDCTAQPTACQETRLLNQLDGFSVRARAAVQFSAPVDLTTVPSGIFFVALDELTKEEKGIHAFGQQIALDQVVFDPSTNTVYGKPVSALDQHRHYALIVTDAVTDASGAAVAADPAFQACLQSSTAYCTALAAAVAKITVAPAHIVSASLFTTMSATYWLEQARTIVANTPPSPVLATPQSAFPIASLDSLTLHEQTGANPTQFTDLSIPLPVALLAGVARLVIGTYQSPNFLQEDQTIPSGANTLPIARVPPDSLTTSTIYYNALLPSSAKPATGYPVVIFGHGLGDSRFGGPTAVASTLAQAGFAVIAINAVGHGFGPMGTVTFTDKQKNSVTLPSGGRGVDLNNDGTIGADEGCILVAPIAYGTRDCFRQTVVDLMQLTHTIQLGLDLDGDGTPDLDASHIYYGGQSLGAMYGTIFTAVEPSVRAATLNVGGASAVDVARWSPAYHLLATEMLDERVPALLNLHGSYDEDYVLPEQPPHIVAFRGAMAIQNVFENLEWLSMQGDPIAFASHLSVSPLPSTAARPVLFQMARADRTMPNPASSALIRAAGGMANAWMYRHDLALAADPALPLDPHPFLVFFVSLSGSTVQLTDDPRALLISLSAQGQMAGFFTADGTSIPDPNTILLKALFGFPVFQQPAPLPEDFGFAGKPLVERRSTSAANCPFRTERQPGRTVIPGKTKHAVFRFYAELNDFLPPRRRFREFRHEFLDTATAKDFIESFGVPHTEVDLILANGLSVDFSYRVQDGDHVSVYPVFESFDIAPLERLRPEPLREPRFVLDVHLGRLAAYLRMLGFDALYRNDYGDQELAAISGGEERRILLTRDAGLLKRGAVTHGYYVRETNARRQLREIVRRFDLARLCRPFTRCMRCNTPLEEVTKEEVAADLPPRTAESHQEFRRCPGCGRVYWKGAHYRRMLEMLPGEERNVG